MARVGPQRHRKQNKPDRLNDKKGSWSKSFLDVAKSRKSLIQNNLPATIGNTVIAKEMGVEISSPNASPKYNLP